MYIHVRTLYVVYISGHMYIRISTYILYQLYAAHSREDETRNGERNVSQNPEWWGDFSHLVEIEKIKFHGISRY